MDVGSGRVVALLAGALAATAIGAGGITPAAAGGALATVSVDDTFVIEHGAGTGTVAVPVVLSAVQDEPVTVTITTSNGTATAPADFTALSQVVEVPAGRMIVEVEVPIFADTTVEGDERFTVDLSAPVNASLGDAHATVLLVDDDYRSAVPLPCYDPSGEIDCGASDAPIRTGVRVIEDLAQPSTCPAGATCTPVVVDCLGLPAARAYVALTAATAPARGLVVMLIGAGGTGYYDDTNRYMSEFTDAGFALARFNWPDGWNNPLPTGPYGVTTTACRTAALAEHVYETEYLPMDIDQPATVCGFCLTGSSSGGLLGGYLLGEYGLESILDAVVATSGPLPTKIMESCLEPGGDETYKTTQDSFVDAAYGVIDGKGPCTAKDESYAEVWQADSLADADDDFVYPKTRFDILIGGDDHTTAPAHATAYYERLLGAGNTTASYTVVPGAGHTLPVFLSVPAARAAILEALLREPAA